ncbi:MAG: GNAT family N-acetyltransferase [Anaeroplasmataceae bacterium]
MIKRINFENIFDSLDFINEVYLKTEYKNDSKEGYETFLKEFIRNKDIITSFKEETNIMYGYYIDNNLIGVISLDDENYIYYLFVSPDYHNKGIASKLLHYVENIVLNRANHTIRLDSSIFGYDFYLKKGFKETSNLITKNGMNYIPMIKEL